MTYTTEQTIEAYEAGQADGFKRGFAAAEAKAKNVSFLYQRASNELDYTGFSDALKATNKEYSGLSWGGFNLWGDRRSIQEVQRIMHMESWIKPLQDRLENTQNILDAVKAKYADK